MAKEKKPYNQSKMLKLWESGRSLKQIAEVIGCSRVYAHRVLTTKYKAQYQAGVKVRRDEKAKAAREGD
jgi:hypothetical protein